jgi:hypothetical protein
MSHSGGLRRYLEATSVFAGVTSAPHGNPKVLILTRSFSRLVGVLLASLLIAPAAHAAQINGNPLTVASGDDAGNLGATFTGSGLTEFYGSSVDTTTGQLRPAGSAGFVVVTVNGQNSTSTFGSRRAGLVPTSAPVVTGTGVAGDPFKIVQTFRDPDPAIVDIRQEISYVNGQTEFQARLTVTNVSGQPQTMRISMGADMAGGGNDRGNGLLEAGPPRFAGGLNTAVGAVAGLAEITPWSHFEEGQYSGVLSRADASPASGHLADTVDPTEVDYGVAAQWDHGTVGPGGAVSDEVAWRFRRTYGLTPEKQSLNTGDTAQFKVSTTNTQGAAQAGTHIRWSALGSNSATGDVRTGADGSAAFEYIGANPGSDRVTAYADLNDNATRDPGEPEREAAVDWTGPGAPAFAQQVNVRPVSGTVLIKLPKGSSAKLGDSAWIRKAQSGFVRMTDAMQVPVGAELDASRGRVSMTSSKGATGGVQTAQFYSGRFQALQSAREKGLTEVRMTQPLTCKGTTRAKTTAAARKVRSRKLWGSGKGRFRTRGRNSSATVRGTTWLQKDTCTTTTTSVKQGVVSVRDFVKRKTVTVKAGRRYVARSR